MPQTMDAQRFTAPVRDTRVRDTFTRATALASTWSATEQDLLLAFEACVRELKILVKSTMDRSNAAIAEKQAIATALAKLQWVNKSFTEEIRKATTIAGMQAAIESLFAECNRKQPEVQAAMHYLRENGSWDQIREMARAAFREMEESGGWEPLGADAVKAKPVGGFKKWVGKAFGRT